MTNTIDKRLTRDEMTAELEDAFAGSPAVITVEVRYLINILSTALFDLQTETETRVRREMLRGSLN